MSNIVNPEDYIQSRRDAMWEYIRMGMRLLDLNGTQSCYRTAKRLLRKDPTIRMRTADKVYQAARQLTGVTIPVKGAQYEKWHQDTFAYIDAYQRRHRLNMTQICAITGFHGSRYVNVQRGNTVVIGRKLYDYYQNLLAYENVRNRKCA